MGKIINAHDSFLRSLLADKQVAIDYFRSALPAHIADKLDFSTLEPLSGTYVSKELQTTISDVVYTCQRRDGRGSVHICLLVEHKSAPDKYTPVQIGGYLFSGYGQQIRQKHEQLSPIIPILFYHGKQRWEYWTLDRLFDGLEAELLGFLPNFDYIYANLRDTPDGVIKAIENRFLVSALLLLKHAFEELWLSQNFKDELVAGLGDASGVLQQAFLMYYFGRAKITPGQLGEMLNDLPLPIRDTVMSTYDMIYDKGRKEERARAQRLIEQERAKAYAEKLRSALEFKKMGIPIADIAKGLQLSVEEVEKL